MTEPPPSWRNCVRAAPDRAPALIRAALAKAASARTSTPRRCDCVLAVDQMEELFTTQTGPAREASRSPAGFVRHLRSCVGDRHRFVETSFTAAAKLRGFQHSRTAWAAMSYYRPPVQRLGRLFASRRELRVFASRRRPTKAVSMTCSRQRQEPIRNRCRFSSSCWMRCMMPCRDRRLLTFAAYRALGGLEGAIARRADEVVEALPPHVQDTLPVVIRSLTTVRLGDEAITAAPVLATEVTSTPAQAALVEALIAARLLVSDEDAEGRAVVRVAHDSLLGRWPKARNLINANREFLETRARVQADSRRWHSDDKNADLLLPAGKRLVEAEELLLSRGEEIDGPTADYDSSVLACAQREGRKGAEIRTGAHGG